MKEKYVVKSDRYGHNHSFVKVKDDEYVFLPEKKWMPLYVNYEEDGKEVSFIDTEGGPCIGRGWSNDEIIVSDIIKTDNDIRFRLREK